MSVKFSEAKVSFITQSGYTIDNTPIFHVYPWMNGRWEQVLMGICPAGRGQNAIYI